MHKLCLFSLLFLFACGQIEKKTMVEVNHTSTKINIDGQGIDTAWEFSQWRAIDQRWLGEAYDENDFSARYKMLWDKDYLYLLAEIKDDQLVDFHPDGLDKYWDDDCLEVFIDEDNSKGDHQYNHNAFAYHIALNGRVADIGTDSLPHYYDHILNRRSRDGDLSTWELAISIYDDTYKDGGNNLPKGLGSNKIMGFAIAYCDNDESEERENFIGSVPVQGEDKNRGWIDAGIFEEIILVSK